MPELKFAENTADEGEGLSDSGIETYRDDPFPAVARETVQNSRDAHDGSGEPVKIEFDRLTIVAADFPDRESFLSSARSCLEVAKAEENEKETAFFEQAVSVLEGVEIPLLKIADYNTKGLRGPCTSTPPTPFYALVKSSGSSVKDNQSAGGSFGIGKSAVYSASDLQTVFYSTVYHCDESGSAKFMCQGKTKFRSHQGADGVAYRSTGYWGNPIGYAPVESSNEAPEWARREDRGTSVFSLGVRDSEDWKDGLVCSIIVNFYGAIHEGKMELRVEDQEISRTNLSVLFDDPAVRGHARTEDDFDFAKLGFECVSDPTTTKVFEIDGVGKFRLDLLIRDGLPKKVVVLRNGMVICTSLDHFGDKLQYFRLHKDFIAVLQPVEPREGETAPNSSEWMRRLEDPRHDKLSPERLSKETDRRTAKAKGGALARTIREIIKSEAKKPTGQRTALDELSEFFADNAPREEDPLGQRGLQTVKIKKKPNTTTKRPNSGDSDEGEGNEGGGATLHGGGSKGNSSGSGKGSGSGGAGARRPRQPFGIKEVRTIIPSADSPEKRRIFFTPLEAGTARLRFLSSGISDSEELRLADGADYLEVACIANARAQVDLEFESAYSGPIEIVASTSTEETGL